MTRCKEESVKSKIKNYKMIQQKDKKHKKELKGIKT